MMKAGAGDVLLGAFFLVRRDSCGAIDLANRKKG
jgi:hypothetical protein